MILKGGNSLRLEVETYLDIEFGLIWISLRCFAIAFTHMLVVDVLCVW